MDHIINSKQLAELSISLIPGIGPKTFYKIINHLTEEKQIERLLNLNIPYLFTNIVEEYNAIFGQQQIENIASTLNIINNNKYDKLETMKKNNIQKCMIWCQKYKISYNKVINSINIFLSGKSSFSSSSMPVADI